MVTYRLEGISSSGPTPTAPTFYVKNGGNDSLDGRSVGTAWATLDKVNATTFAPGNVIAFKCGDVWRGRLTVPLAHGAAGNPITYTSYGTGAKPLIIGSRNLSSSALWTQTDTNVWACTLSLTYEIVALIYNGDAAVGWRRADVASLTTQGDYVWVSPGTLYVYSVGNPGTYYTVPGLGGATIEATEGAPSASVYGMAWHSQTRRWQTVRGLHFRYHNGGLCTYTTTGIVFEENDVHYIGAGVAALPAGNAIQISDGTDCVVRNNVITHAYDTAITTINKQNGVEWYGNICSYCENMWELQSAAVGTIAANVSVHHNVGFKGGYGAWHGQRPSTRYQGFQSWGGGERSSNCSFNDNITYGSLFRQARVPSGGWTADRNRWYPNGTYAFQGTNYDNSGTNFAGYQALGFDTNGSIMSAISGTDEQILASLKALVWQTTRDGLIVFDGNSLTVGYGGTTGHDYPTVCMSLLPSVGYNWTKVRVAVGGQTTLDMLADVTTQVDPLYSASRYYNIVCCFTGTIDGGTGASREANIRTYCAGRQAAGFKVVVLTIPSYSSTSSSRTDANTLIRANWTQYANALADVGADPYIGQNDSYQNTTYFTDGTHMTDAGYAIVAQYVADAIETLL